jgi:hypothetical protein
MSAPDDLDQIRDEAGMRTQQTTITARDTATITTEPATR